MPAQAGTQRGVECRGLSRVPGMDSCFRRNGCGQGRDAAPRPLTTPAKAGVYRLLLRGASYSPPPRPWIPAFAGMVAVRGGTRPAPIDHPCESRGLPPHTMRRPYSPPPRPWIPAFAGMVAVRGGTRPAPIDHPCESRGLPPHTMRRPVFTTAPALDSCFRRNGCGQGRDAAPRPSTTPAKAGVYRLILCGAPYSPLPRPWIPAFAGMVAVRGETRPPPIDHPCESRGLPPHTMRRPVFTTATALDSCFRRNGCEWPTLTLPGQASLALHGGAVRAAPAGTSADCAVSRKPCPPADPLRCVSGSWGSPSATGPSGRTRR